ncbi:MAG: PAS domain S-box protein, partial [Ktedonobacteraceae bacterium]
HNYIGIAIGEAEKQYWQAILHPEDRVKLQHTWQDALATGADLLSEVRIKRRDGVYRWNTIRAAAQRDAEGKIWLWVGTCTDIDEQKQAEQTLAASEANFHALAETIPQLVWTDLADGSMVYCNQRYLDYIHATFKEAQGSGWESFLHPDELEGVLTRMERSLATGETYEVEHRFKEGKTGMYHWFLTRAMPVHDETEQIVKWVGTSTGIDEQKRTEEALRLSEMRLRHLVDANIVGVTITDLEGTIHEANDAFLSLVGYTQKDLKAGRIHWPSMTPPEYRERDAQAVKKILRTGAFPPYEKEYTRKDGRRVPVTLAGAIFRWEGSVPWWITLTVDMTAGKEVERQKDFFLAMTGHELKTPLTTLKGTLQLAQRRVKHFAAKTGELSPELHTLMDTLSEHLAVAIRQVDIQARMISDLLDMSHITTNTLKLEMKPCDLASIVRETIEDLRVMAPARA